MFFACQQVNIFLCFGKPNIQFSMAFIIMKALKVEEEIYLIIFRKLIYNNLFLYELKRCFHYCSGKISGLHDNLVSSIVCMLCRLLYYSFVRFYVMNVLAFVFAVLSHSVVILEIFFNIVIKREVWLAIKPGLTHHFF